MPVFRVKIPLLILTPLFALNFASAEDEKLPFDPKLISRASLDGVPRSLSVRQGESWIGYDLERGTPFHVWRSKLDTTGLIVNGFTTRSEGETRFADSSDASWRLLREGKPVECSFRYRSCSDRGDAIELVWEFRHGNRAVLVTERVAPRTDAAETVVRHLEVTGLSDGETLHPPLPVAERWTLVDSEGDTCTKLERDGAYRLLLSP